MYISLGAQEGVAPMKEIADGKGNDKGNNSRTNVMYRCVGHECPDHRNLY